MVLAVEWLLCGLLRCLSVIRRDRAFFFIRLLCLDLVLKLLTPFLEPLFLLYLILNLLHLVRELLVERLELDLLLGVLDLALALVSLLQSPQASIPEIPLVLLLNLILLGQLLTRALGLVLGVVELLPLALREEWVLNFWLLLRLLLVDIGILGIVLLRRRMLLLAAVASSLAYPYHVVSLCTC